MFERVTEVVESGCLLYSEVTANSVMTISHIFLEEQVSISLYKEYAPHYQTNTHTHTHTHPEQEGGYVNRLPASGKQKMATVINGPIVVYWSS